jgi:hypoxanthine phosphoribosyltransferase
MVWFVVNSWRSQTMSIVKHYITYEDMNQKHLANIFRQMAIDEFKPEVVVGITRGGLVPAVHASHYFDVPLRTVHISLRDHANRESLAEIQKLVDEGKRILIVDDICDEGATLRVIHDELHGNFPHDSEVDGRCFQVKYAVLVHNLGGTEFEPDYWGEEINKVEKPVWVVFPYEY